MNNFYPKQYQDTGVYPINHNYLPKQFAEREAIYQAIDKVVSDGDFTLGQAVDKFEQDFARLNQGKYAVGVGSGTDALFLSLKALGVGEGDEVITTPFTFFATVGAIVTAGATPVFVDVKLDFNIDVAKIEQAITAKTKAIMPVHWSGNPCDLTQLKVLSEKHAIPIVADACHAIEASYKGEGVAVLPDVSCFSMHPLKNLNVWGDGGVIVTNDETLAKKLALIRNHGLKNRDECLEFAYNSRLDTIQAVVAQHLIDSGALANITQSRIQNSLYLDEALSDIPQISMPARSTEKQHVFHLYMGLFERRDELQTFLQAQGIDAKVHYPIPMHLQPAAAKYGHKVGDFPVAEQVANNCLSLPVHEYIERQELDFVVEKIREFYRG